jgi:hypothetical protein
MLQAPEGDVLTNCDAVMKLAVPGTGTFLARNAKNIYIYIYINIPIFAYLEVN